MSAEESIRQLHAGLSDMFDMVDEQLADTVNALVTADRSLAEAVRARDKQVDAMERDHDAQCFRILNSSQPQDKQLRMVIAALRISSHLERIGDLCKNVCKATPRLDDHTGWRSDTYIMDLADAARRIVRAARDAFAGRDRLKARLVLAYDRQVDRAYRETLATLEAKRPVGDSGAGTLLYLATISKALERIADHAKSIARCVVYFVEGTDIRYAHSQGSTNSVRS